MSRFARCRSCSRSVNRFLEVCPYCGADLKRDSSEAPQPPVTQTGDGAPGEGFRQIRSVAVFVELAFGLFILASIVVVMTGWAYRHGLLDVAAEGPGSLVDAARSEDNYLTASAVLGAMNVFLIVTFVTWFWRSYANLPVLGRTTKRKPGWAIGSWLIPLANFVIPYSIGAEIWKKSRVDSGRDEENMEPVISWWALFLIMGLVNQVSFFTSGDIGDDVERMAAAVSIDLVGAVMSIAAALAAARFVRLATARQESLAIACGVDLNPSRRGPIR